MTRAARSWRRSCGAGSRRRWPQLREIQLRYRAGFAYVDGVLTDGEVLQLCRLRYGGSARDWGFAMYRASHDDYEKGLLHG